ncbi:MAG: 1-deoxy-D-xylulose-5-phosphate reductoisomerase [Clostridia bacterium]|nr:1-deoxy-D-xylulose-5-phosphate reductoisomerase [Clostridia bacterium]
MIKIALLGSTGSIGRQVLNVVDRYPEKFKIVTMAAGSNAAIFNEQINKYKPTIATLSNPEKAVEITSIPNGTSFYYGENSLIHAITDDVDIVFVAVMGYSGLNAVKTAIEMGKNVALANKETLVAGGGLIMPLAKKHGVKIIPVDSEHSAIWQCLDFNEGKKFKKLIITASGGAFKNKSVSELETVTAKDALCHPTWQMGKKITIDCATMMNKAFEVIEAMWLFDTPIDKIDVVIHPESIIHSMVEFDDGAIIAQMGNPSMEVPIQLALTYPNRFNSDVEPLNLIGKSLNFKEVDYEKYPCFPLAIEVIKKGGVYPCAMSAADEEVVKLFLEEKIKYLDIKRYLEYALSKVEDLPLSFENLEKVDKMARKAVYELYNKELNG